jgi:putative membrane protein
MVILPVLMAVFTVSCTAVRAASLHDQIFMRREIQAGDYELGFARLGLARALRPEIRAYAQTMINDHARGSQALRALARSENVSLPPAMDRRSRQRLHRLAATPDSAFDTAFLREVRRTHNDGIRTLQMEASHTSDPAMRGFALQALNLEKKHQRLARSLGNTRLALREVVIHPPRTGDPIIVVPAPSKSPMPIIHPPLDGRP